MRKTWHDIKGINLVQFLHLKKVNMLRKKHTIEANSLYWSLSLLFSKEWVKNIQVRPIPSIEVWTFCLARLKVIKARGTKNKYFMPSHSPKQRFRTIFRHGCLKIARFFLFKFVVHMCVYKCPTGKILRSLWSSFCEVRRH